MKEMTMIFSKLFVPLAVSVLAACVLHSEAQLYPGLAALLPVAGTAAIILFAGVTTPVGRLLSSRPFVAIGLISYSAYLWHQPLFALARAAALDGPDKGVMALLSLLTLLLALLGLTGLHVVAALKHQWVDRDGLLTRMLPGRA